MKNHKMSALVVIGQIVCVVGWYIWAPLPRFFSISINPVVGLASPLLFEAIISFLFSLFLPIELNFREALGLSVPAFLVYFCLYLLVGITRADTYEFLSTIMVFCVYFFPMMAGMFLINGLAVWSGSLIHSKLFKQKDEPAD